MKHSFDEEFQDDHARAVRKYKDWLKLHARELMKHPSFKGISKQQFTDMLTKETEKEAAGANAARRDLIEAMEQGKRESGKKSRSGGRGGERGSEGRGSGER